MDRPSDYTRRRPHVVKRSHFLCLELHTTAAFASASICKQLNTKLHTNLQVLPSYHKIKSGLNNEECLCAIYLFTGWQLFLCNYNVWVAIEHIRNGMISFHNLNPKRYVLRSVILDGADVY